MGIMNKEEVVKELKERFKDSDASNVEGVVAAQVDLRDEEGGTLYLEVKDKTLSIEPYEYYDRNVILNVSSSDLLEIVDKKLNPADAISKGILNAEGDLDKALEILNLYKPKIEDLSKPQIEEKSEVEIEEKPEGKIEATIEVKAESKPTPKTTAKTKGTNKTSTKTTARPASKTTSKSKTKAKTK